MSNGWYAWFVLLFAIAAANTPFVTQRLFVFIAVENPKSLGLRLLELVSFYFCAGGVGAFFEQRAGQIAPQSWEFFAITAALFLTFAFPGFVYRYLLKWSR